MTRTIVVTGSGSGIGRATVELLRNGGDRVIGVDLADADVCADLSTRDGCATMASEVEKMSGGRVDAVVANAGVPPGTPSSLIYAVNYFGARNTVESLRPLLRNSSTPRAAITASSATSYPCDSAVIEALERGEENPEAGDYAYVASKHAIARWVRRVSPEWAEAGIPINVLAPGGTDTPLLRQGVSDEHISAVVAGVPAKRLAAPEEMAAVLAFLVSAQNSFVAGQVIYADGAVEAAQRPERI